MITYCHHERLPAGFRVFRNKKSYCKKYDTYCNKERCPDLENETKIRKPTMKDYEDRLVDMAEGVWEGVR